LITAKTSVTKNPSAAADSVKAPARAATPAITEKAFVYSLVVIAVPRAAPGKRALTLRSRAISSRHKNTSFLKNHN